MTASKIMAKRAAAGTLALAVCLTGGLVSAGAANAAAGFTFDTRIAGADRYETSVAASAAAFPTGASSVVITNGLSEVDGLTASYVAGLHSAPILYTSGPSTVSTAVQAEITRLKPTTVYIVGGETVVSKQLEDAMKATYGATNVVRYGGADRYETAAKVATSGTTAPDKVFVASGVSFADALVAGPVAYKQNYPILLTAATGVPSFTEAALADLDVDTVNVVGGTTVVTDATYAAVGGDKRLAGETRQATAAAFAVDAIANEGFSSANVALVGNTNANAADALVAAPLAAQNNTPILFVDNAGNTATATYLTTNASKLTGEGYVFGGTAAVSEAAVTAATTAAQSTTGTVGNIAVTPANAVTLVGLTSVDTVADDRTYSVSGLTADIDYRVTLVPTRNIAVSANGAVTFRSSVDSASASGFSADASGVSSRISVINGSVTAASVANTTTARAVNGNLTFTVDGTETAESVTPVVYINGGTGRTAAQGGPSIRLETSATTAGAFAAATETFGLGGAVTYAPVEADGGVIDGDTTNNTPTFTADAATITYVDKANDYVVAGDRTYYYDASDTFQISPNAAPITFANFEANLSTGDSIVGTYATDPALQSSFGLNDITPVAITSADAVAVDSSSVKITWSAGTPEPTSYNVYRKAGAESATLADYTLVSNVAGGINTFTDTGLTASTAYSYAITQVVDGDESPITLDVSTDAVSTTAVGFTAAPESTKIGVTNDTGFQGILTAGDVTQFGFSRVMDSNADGADTELVRVQDANGESLDLDFSGATLNATAQSFQGSTFAAGTLFNYTVPALGTIVDRDGNTANNTGSLEYPLTVTNASGVTATVNSAAVAWTPAGDPDVTLETGVTASTATSNPIINDAAIGTVGATAGFGNDVNDTATFTFSEAIALGADVTGANNVSAADLAAITGAAANTGFVGTAGVVGNVLTITTTTAGSVPLVAGTAIPGSATTLIADTDGQTEIAATSPTTL